MSVEKPSGNNPASQGNGNANKGPSKNNPLVPAFVYTHVLRPSMRDNFEFRTEHFSKVTRKLEDFHIDLSPLYPDGGDEIKGVGYMPPVTDRPDTDDSDDETFDDEPYDAEWETDESSDAARLEGAADEMLDELKEVLEDPAWEDDSDDADYL